MLPKNFSVILRRVKMLTLQTTRALLLLKVSQSEAFWDKIRFPRYLDFKINSRAKILLLIGILNFESSAIFEAYKRRCH